MYIYSNVKYISNVYSDKYIIKYISIYPIYYIQMYKYLNV